jgi:hypothetical protein
VICSEGHRGSWQQAVTREGGANKHTIGYAGIGGACTAIDTAHQVKRSTAQRIKLRPHAWERTSKSLFHSGYSAGATFGGYKEPGADDSSSSRSNATMRVTASLARARCNQPRMNVRCSLGCKSLVVLGEPARPPCPRRAAHTLGPKGSVIRVVARKSANLAHGIPPRARRNV